MSQIIMKDDLILNLNFTLLTSRFAEIFLRLPQEHIEDKSEFNLMIGNFKVFQQAICFIEFSVKSFTNVHKASQTSKRFQFVRNNYDYYIQEIL